MRITIDHGGFPYNIIHLPLTVIPFTDVLTIITTGVPQRTSLESMTKVMEKVIRSKLLRKDWSKLNHTLLSSLEEGSRVITFWDFVRKKKKAYSNQGKHLDTLSCWFSSPD